MEDAVIGSSGPGFPVPADSRPIDNAIGASAARLGLSLALIALAMAFLALFTSYIVLRSGHRPWPPEGVRLNIPLGWVNTAVLVGSSLAFVSALKSARADALHGARTALQIGGLLALGFLCLQALQYYWLIYDFGETIRSSPFGTTFYALTGLHAIHVIAGVIWLLPLSFSSRRRSALRIELCGNYWHFVTVVWSAIFLLFYLV